MTFDPFETRYQNPGATHSSAPHGSVPPIDYVWLSATVNYLGAMQKWSEIQTALFLNHFTWYLISNGYRVVNQRGEMLVINYEIPSGYLDILIKSGGWHVAPSSLPWFSPTPHHGEISRQAHYGDILGFVWQGRSQEYGVEEQRPGSSGAPAYTRISWQPDPGERPVAPSGIDAPKSESEADEDAFELYIDPGEASVDDLRAVFSSINELHVASGGLGLLYSMDEAGVTRAAGAMQ